MSTPQPIFTFSGFSFDQVNIVLKALRELPYKESADLIHGITNATDAQIKEFQNRPTDKETMINE